MQVRHVLAAGACALAALSIFVCSKNTLPVRAPDPGLHPTEPGLRAPDPGLHPTEPGLRAPEPGLRAALHA